MAFQHLTLTALAATSMFILQPTEGCGGTTTDYPREVATDGGTYWVTYTPNPDPIPMGEAFSMKVSVYSNANQTDLQEDVKIAADAWMPDHGHGMPTVPKVTPNGDGTFTVSNMTFSMNGYWQILVDVSRSGKPTEEAIFEVDCCE